jgi:hypothetical protein
MPTVVELKEELVALGIDPESVKGLKKAALEKMLADAKNAAPAPNAANDKGDGEEGGEEIEQENGEEGGEEGGEESNGDEESNSAVRAAEEATKKALNNAAAAAAAAVAAAAPTKKSAAKGKPARAAAAAAPANMSNTEMSQKPESESQKLRREQANLRAKAQELIEKERQMLKRRATQKKQALLFNVQRHPEKYTSKQRKKYPFGSKKYDPKRYVLAKPKTKGFRGKEGHENARKRAETKKIRGLFARQRERRDEDRKDPLKREMRSLYAQIYSLRKTIADNTERKSNLTDHRASLHAEHESRSERFKKVMNGKTYKEVNSISGAQFNTISKVYPTVNYAYAKKESNAISSIDDAFKKLDKEIGEVTAKILKEQAEYESVSKEYQRVLRKISQASATKKVGRAHTA